MALTSKSLFLYGYTIDETNYALPFRAASAGPDLIAALDYGYYSLTDLLTEISTQMETADPTNIYVATADRTVAAGLENRVYIQTSGLYLDINFLTSSASAYNCHEVIGFNQADYTGTVAYSGASTTGTSLVPTFIGYDYSSPNQVKEVNGALNISTSGLKELIVFQVQEFLQVQFKYEPEDLIEDDWAPLMTWLIQQRYFEFTPELATPSIFYNCTLESNALGGEGTAYMFNEMLPEFPFLFDTGLMKFRKKVV